MPDVKILEQAETDESEVPPEKTARWLTCLIEAIILLLAVTLIIVVRQSWLEPVEVTSGSMENTLKKDDRVLLDHRASLAGSWKRGDIVMIDTENESWGEDRVIKRIIGLPGETIQIFGGKTYVNGKPLSENYLKETPEKQDVPPILLGADEYYVMGDNRNHSGDSRELGPVKASEIKGRALRKLWPWGRLPQPDYGE
jgi:signal peptidase I